MRNLNLDYSNKKQSYFSTPRHELIDHVPDGPNRVLEIGCGNGATLIALREMGRAREIVGVDIMPFETQLDRFLTADIEEFDVPYPPGYFGVILCGDVLEHLIDPWTTTTRLVELLEPGGLFIVSVPNIGEVYALFKIFIKGDFAYEDSGIFDRTHLRFFCKKNVREMLEQAGLVVKSFHFSPSNGKREGLNTLTLGLFERFLSRQLIAVSQKP